MEANRFGVYLVFICCHQACFNCDRNAITFAIQKGFSNDSSIRISEGAFLPVLFSSVFVFVAEKKVTK